MTDASHPTHVHPLQRLAKRNRLVVAVRGGAGSGKSSFAASLAEAGQGRLCLFDTERKARLIPGSDGTRFDALEVNTPDELPEFITWALTEGRDQRQYGCFALDSFAMYFGRKHAETLRRLRELTGDPLAQPSADQLAADQMLFQEVLRRLCVDSGASVVITDQIPARVREERTENELGRVLPVTLSGLEYFVDVLLELEVRMEGFETVRVGRVVKSNSQAFPLGLDLHNPTFADLLRRQAAFTPGPSGSLVPADTTPGTTAESASVERRDSTRIYAEVEQIVREAEAARSQAEAQVQAAAQQRGQMTFATLVERAAALGVTRAQLLVAADHYHGVTNPARLTPEQITDLHQRLTDRYGAAPIEPTTWQPATGAPTLDDEAPTALRRPGSEAPTSARVPETAVHEAPPAQPEQPKRSNRAERPQR